jgi:hypothetical protein
MASETNALVERLDLTVTIHARLNPRGQSWEVYPARRQTPAIPQCKRLGRRGAQAASAVGE